MRRFPAFPLLALALFLASPRLQAQTNPTTIEGAAAIVAVNPASVIVTRFEGWGTSLCWWAHVVGGYSNREEYASLAFTKLGLNIVRYNIGGGENPGLPGSMQYRARVPGFAPRPGEWDWSADPNQRWMLRRAIALGADRVEAFANSPPWWMTRSGSVTGATNGASGNLLPEQEAAFAHYLVTVVSNLARLDHVSFHTLTPLNEPTSSWWTYGNRQEGCRIDPPQQARLIRLLVPALARSAPAVGLAASEDNDEKSTMRSLEGYDPEALRRLSFIATHTYGANNPSGLKRLAETTGKPLWVSEYGDGDRSGLTMAHRILQDLTRMAARAWVYWQVVDNGRGWGLLYNRLDGGGDTSCFINPKFYVLWQFSHFVRPGCRILSVGDNWSLAAYDPAKRQLILVAVNDTRAAVPLAYDLRAFDELGDTVACCRTSASESGAELPSLSLSHKQLAVRLAPRSVTTFVIPERGSADR